MSCKGLSKLVRCLSFGLCNTVSWFFSKLKKPKNMKTYLYMLYKPLNILIEEEFCDFYLPFYAFS